MDDLAETGVASEHVADYFEWVLGWRHFKIDGDGQCHSVANPYIWQPGENQALCQGAKGAPHDGKWGHHCGLNCFYNSNNAAYGSLHALVRGRGDRFAIHPNGFRAEYAEILAFVGGRFPSENIQKAAELYKVPLFKRRWQAERYAKKKHLGEWFPKDRRPQRREIFRQDRNVDWNEIPIGDMSDLLSSHYMIFLMALWICVLIGFIYGAINIGGIV